MAEKTDNERDAIATAQLAHVLKISTEQAAVIVLWLKLAMAFGR